MALFKKLLLVFVVFITADQLYGQSKQISIGGDGATWYNYDSAAARKMDLPDLKIVKDAGHWRIWISKYLAASFVLDIVCKDSVHCKAFLTAYTYGDIDTITKEQFSKVYYKKIDLSDSLALFFNKLTLQLHINQYAMRETINDEKGREMIRVYQTIDSAPYTVEYADRNSYIFKTAGRPADVAEMKRILSAISAKINFEKLKNDFEPTIPFSYYSSNKWMTANRQLTPKQKKQYERYWKKHQNNN